MAYFTSKTYSGVLGINVIETKMCFEAGKFKHRKLQQ